MKISLAAFNCCIRIVSVCISMAGLQTDDKRGHRAPKEEKGEDRTETVTVYNHFI